MYCTICGNLLGEKDIFCKVCGTATGITLLKEKTAGKIHGEHDGAAAEIKVVEEIKKEVEDEIFSEAADRAKESKDLEISWNVYEFPKPKKTEDAEFVWGVEEASNTKESSQTMPSEGETAPKWENSPKTETPLKWETSQQTEAFQQTAFPEVDFTHEKDLEEICADKNEMPLNPSSDENKMPFDPSNPERFFTFSKKNEEFQKLLDREYEKIKSRENSDPRILKANEGIRAVAEMSDNFEPLQEVAVKDAQVQEQEMVSQNPQSQEQKVVPQNPQSQEQEVVSQNIPSPAVELWKITEVAEMQETKDEELPLKVETYEDLSDISVSESLGDSSIQDNETLRKKFETKEIKPLNKTPKVEVIHIEKLDDALDTLKETTGESFVEDIEKTKVPGDENTDPLSAFFDRKDVEEQPPSRGRGGIILRILAVIVVVLLIAQLACMGIQRFYPDSQVAKTIGKQQVKMVEQIAEWVEIIKGSDQEKSKPDGEKKAQGKDAKGVIDFGDVDTTPVADKNLIIANNASRNSNIQSVIANDALAYIVGKNYGVTDINNSQPLTNNGWLKDDQGNVTFYDNEIVGTLMAFGSQWVDYVNAGNKSVLDLLKPDSQAYKNAVNSTELGKITETFYRLEIGEIRQGENGYYIWCHEKKQLSQGGVGAENEYNWIYYVEPDGSNMKVVNYYKF